MIAKPSTHSLPSRLRAASAGLLLAVFTLLFGQGMGIVFGLNEDLIKSQLKADATAVQTTIYKDDQNVSKAVLDKSWNYMQRAHLHAGGLGTAAIALIIVLCLIVGVAAAESSRSSVLVAGLAGLVAGAMSMAAGEYVSVSSQSDTENADLERERLELANDSKSEHAELTDIYVSRGLDAGLAAEVATQLMAEDALGAHARDELGISENLSARPVQAAFASAGTFAVGAALPLLLVLFLPLSALVWTVSLSSLAFLALLGALAARAGGSSVWISVVRVTFWGALAMALTAGVGAMFRATR